jgi:RNA polymerase sigma factor (sigma-70 family)
MGAVAPDARDGPDFPAWMAGIAAGQPEAEGALVEYFLPRVRAMVLARIRDADQAADLAQDVLVAVLIALRRGQAREPERLPGFVLGVARNTANNHLRGVRRRAESALDEGVLTIAVADTQEVREREEAVTRGLEEVPAGDREVLLLTLVEGLNPRDIARRLDISSEVVRQRKSRALKRITAVIEGLSRNTPLRPL